MSVISVAVKYLIASGVSGEDLVQAIAEMEAALAPGAPVRTARQERNRRYYEKKASEKRLNQTVKTVSDGQETLSSPEVSPPHPLPKPSNPIPPSPPKGGSSPTAVDQVVTACRTWPVDPVFRCPALSRLLAVDRCCCGSRNTA